MSDSDASAEESHFLRGAERTEQTKRAFLSRLQLPQLSQALCERGRPIVDVALSVAVETVAGRRGRHGDSAAQPAARASSCASAPATTRRPDTAAASAWDRAERRGEDPNGAHVTSADLHLRCLK